MKFIIYHLSFIIKVIKVIKTWKISFGKNNN